MAEVDYKMKVVSEERISDGSQKVIEHWSPVTKSRMKFAIYIPDLDTPDEKLDTFIFLPGTGSNQSDFLLPTKFQQHACHYRFIVVSTDTSPRVVVPGDRVSFTYGKSAGWYMDTLQDPWKKHYQMYSYVTKELVDLLQKHFPISGKFGICGFSMGGNGALVMALRNPDIFQSVSVFAPCCNVLGWAKGLIFKKFLGEENVAEYEKYDASYLAKGYDGPLREILVDVGKDDMALMITLHPDRLVKAAEGNPKGDSVLKVELRMQDDFDHSNKIIEALIEQHFAHHRRLIDETK